MNQLHFGIKQLKIGKSRGVLHSFVCNHVKYANMEGFRRQSIWPTESLVEYSYNYTYEMLSAIELCTY